MSFSFLVFVLSTPPTFCSLHDHYHLYHHHHHYLLLPFPHLPLLFLLVLFFMSISTSVIINIKKRNLVLTPFLTTTGLAIEGHFEKRMREFILLVLLKHQTEQYSEFLDRNRAPTLLSSLESIAPS